MHLHTPQLKSLLVFLLTVSSFEGLVLSFALFVAENFVFHFVAALHTQAMTLTSLVKLLNFLFSTSSLTTKPAGVLVIGSPSVLSGDEADGFTVA